jgi:hypothetical protein
MQIVFTQEFIMDRSHGVSLTELPITPGERFTVIILKEGKPVGTGQAGHRKAYAHRFLVDNIVLPSRDELHER